MKLKILGLVFILLGFAAPFILRATFPKFLYASSISIVSFWTGFLLILRPLDYKAEFSPYLKWASYAIWLNIVLTILLTIYFYVVFTFDIQEGFGGYSVLYYLGFVVNPIRSVFDSLVAQPSLQQADGRVIVTYSFARSLLTCFFNLVFYSSAVIFIKIFKDKKITRQLRGIGL